MKPTDYIEWDNLKNIPFFLCQVVEDKENKDIDIYYLGKRVFHDYDHVGHYMRSAIILFRRIKNRTADWVNLQNLWTLRNCIRENYNHGIGVDSLIYGEDFDLSLIQSPSPRDL
ncbi:exo-poly-alpha-D-galacturonosidase, partial [Intestinimonas butyriciproducens]|uniref:exo-poly-alpha-D-galacturonosidase n=1 Tax=Intestinimonas butyriciproducens TaxID=1297617 RepID=UPI0034A25224